MYMTEYDEEKTMALIRKEAREEGRNSTILSNARSLMDSMHWTAQETLSKLQIPENEQARYLKLLTDAD